MAWLEARRMLARFVRQGAEPAAMARHARRLYDGSRRKWRFARGPRIAGFDTIAWTRTVAGLRMDDLEAYRADVERWAASVVADTEAFVRRMASSSADDGV